MTRAYESPKAGEWIRPVRRGYKLACCDCGLVHLVNFRVRKGRVEFQVFRANRSTALMRRLNGIRVRTR
jgi:hypothetical protein